MKKNVSAENETKVINPAEMTIVRSLFNGTLAKNTDIRVALSECDGLIDIRIMSVYHTFAKYNFAINNDGETLTTVTTLYDNYFGSVKELANYAKIVNINALFALIGQCLYSVTTDKSTKTTIRVPYTYGTVFERIVKLVSTIICDETENALTAFGAYKRSKIGEAKKAITAANSEVRKAETAISNFKGVCALFKINPETDETAKKKIAELQAVVTKTRESKENAEKAFEEIKAKNEEQWETEFLNSVNSSELF